MSTLTRTALALAVDYNRPLDELVRKLVTAGCSDWSDGRINPKNFPAKGKGTAQLEAILFPIDHWMESEEILASLEKEGLRAGDPPELAFVGLQHPSEQLKGPIVALGQVWRYPLGDRYVAYLWGHGSGRGLYLAWFDGSWGSDYRFLAFRK